MEFPVGLAGWGPACISIKVLGVLLLQLLLTWGLHLNNLVAKVLWTLVHVLSKGVVS